MVGSSTRGGVAAVLAAYRRCGLFSRWPILLLTPHVDYRAGNASKIWQALTCLGRYCGLLLRGRVMLTHVHASSRGSFWRKSAFVTASAIFRRPVIFHLHSGEFPAWYAARSRLAQCAVRWVLRTADRVVVLSPVWEGPIGAIAGHRRITALANPVADDDLVNGGRQRDRCTMLYMGRLSALKGLPVLLEAAAGLCSRFPELRLVCAGEGDCGQVLRDAERLGIASHLDLPGWVAGEGKARLVRSATLLVLPSQAEGQPVAILEALAAGMPVVATPVGGIPDLVTDEVEGLLVPVGDAPRLRDALARLLSDEGLRERMGRNARDRYRKDFAPDVVLPRLERLYRDLGGVPTDESGTQGPQSQRYQA